MEQITIAKFFSHLCKFQYEKAKSCLDQFKGFNSKIMIQLQNAFMHLINGEKYFNNLLFLSMKSISKLSDKHYEPATYLLDQIAKENSLSRIVSNSGSSFDTISMNNQLQNSIPVIEKDDIDDLIGLVEQLAQFIEFRHQMMKFYFDLKEGRQEKGNFEKALNQLIEIEKIYKGIMKHPLLEEVTKMYSLEVTLMKHLLQCHISIDSNFDCIKSIVSIKKINDMFLTELPLLNSKQSRETKSFSIFSRSSSQQRLMPVLYQWFKVYYQSLLNKFSILMHDSFPNDNTYIMNDKNESFFKLCTYVKKTQPCFIGILLDASRLLQISFRGIGYELCFSASSVSALPGTDCCHLVFLYPKEVDSFDKHIKNVSSLVGSDLDNKIKVVKYFFDNGLKSSYYLCRLTEYYTLFLVLEQNKQENKGKTMAFVQEIGDGLNLGKVYEMLNSNLK